jgi:MFS family permease
LGFSLIFLRETYEPVLLLKRTRRLQKETGNTQLRSKLDQGIPMSEYFKRALIRPSKMLVFSPIVLLLSIYMAVVYGYLYLLFTTLTDVFETTYHFSQGEVGLSFLGIGIGSMIGLIIFGALSDRIMKRMSAKGEMKPEYRLPPLIPGSLVIPIGLFWYGWSADKHVHWIVPIIGTMWVGLGLLATFMPIQTYLVDAYHIHAASAIAANTVLRSLVGAFLPLAGPSMYAALGLGWGNSLLAFIGLALSPLSWIFYRYGEQIRKSPRFQVKL